MTLSKRLVLGGLLGVLVAGCSGTWATDYSDAIAPATSRNWRVVALDIVVPGTLTVSEEDVYRPNADIVWRDDPPGDRHAQVKAIVETAARRGTAGLRGSRPVRLSVTMAEFHALSDISRLRLSHAGVHNIKFTAQVSDARTGAVLAGPEEIRADLPAYTGMDAIRAERRGETQKKRITDHLARVFAGWLGAGPDDVRGAFQRLGR
ncbi:DUF6778 family protein [Rhodovulum euryhalinum]|uniref:Lipoprotein n=1 Tax=Rhodovulum euryhalinum TaxID=35805 RepID=A0A4R2KII9_9RHOB|nr:DUF6778 family protein [Rhodovulum euryhalinum]TCO70369.1 hypothetical protein EV655_110134 [Rhodovulum euryhalinum]